MVTGRAWILATALGIALGLLYVLSPASLWFLVLGTLLVAWAGSGLQGREYQAVVGVTAGSLAVRALAIGVFFLTSDHFNESFAVMVGDERQLLWRAEWLKNIATGAPLAPTDWTFAFQIYGDSALAYMFAALYIVLGNAPYGAHLLNVLLWMAGAVLLHKLLRRSYGKVPAFMSFLLLLFVPSLFAWSISALKEPAFFVLVALALALIVAAVRSRRLVLRLLAASTAILAMKAVGEVRPVGWHICVAGFGLGLAACIVTRRGWLATTAIGCALLLAVYASGRADTQELLLRQLRMTASVHIAHNQVDGYPYKLLDPVFYTRGPAAKSLAPMDMDAALRYALRAVASFVTVPAPWQVVSVPALLFLPQQLMYYFVMLLAPVGIAAGLRRDTLLTWLLTGYCVLGAAIVSLPSGNIGTFIRVRDMIMPFVLCLSGLGAAVTTEFLAIRLTGHRGVGSAGRLEDGHAVAR